MGEFFKLWRRRFGIVTLLMACVFTGGWVRSFFMADGISFVHDKRQYKFNAHDGTLSFSAWRYLNADMGPNSGPEWGTYVYRDSVRVHIYDSRGPISISSKQFGFELFPVIQMVSDYVLISYWLVVVPLTLISLWLLLSKPSKSTQMKTAEPISDEGT